jgi:glycosyltransferase involved in cell wall biosynthesis
MKFTKVLNPKTYIRKLQFIDGMRRYDKYFRSIWPARKYLETISQEVFKYQPLISIIVPTHNTSEDFFREMIESVFRQTYKNWELVVIDDASDKPHVRRLIKQYADRDKRITFTFLNTNHHIAGATNKGFKIARGEFVSLLDHDDILWPNTLYEIVKALNKNKNLDLIYTDEDKMTHDGSRHRDPFLKPDWNPDLLLSMNYITHFTTIRKKLIDKIGGEKEEYNGAQDWDLFLRASEATSADKIHHIPKILYSWRIHDESTAKSFSTKSYVFDSQRKVLQDALKRRGFEKTDYKLYNKAGIWTVKTDNNNIRHGKLNYDLIEGLALKTREIHKNIGYFSLIKYNYLHAQYTVNSKLFIPEDVYRKYW